MKIKTIIVAISLFLYGCSQFNNNLDEKQKNRSDYYKIKRNKDSDHLEKHRSIEMRCGESTFQFEASCYDELEELTDRGSSGGIRNYCKNIELHIKNKIENKIFQYPIMPKYQIDKYNKKGYSFKKIVNDERLVPETFACAKSINNEYYIFIDNHYSHVSNTITDLDRLSKESIILDENGNYVNENLFRILNNENNLNLKFLKSSRTNIMYIGE